VAKKLIFIDMLALKIQAFYNIQDLSPFLLCLLPLPCVGCHISPLALLYVYTCMWNRIILELCMVCRL